MQQVLLPSFPCAFKTIRRRRAIVHEVIRNGMNLPPHM